MLSQRAKRNLILCLLLRRRQKYAVRKNYRRFDAHPFFAKRGQFGAFAHVFPDLLKDNVKFFGYLRMTKRVFYKLLELIEPR